LKNSLSHRHLAGAGDEGCAPRTLQNIKGIRNILHNGKRIFDTYRYWNFIKFNFIGYFSILYKQKKTKNSDI